MTALTEIEAIVPPPAELKLSSGVFVEIQPLKTRQFFRLLKILTRGAGPMLMDIQLDPDMPQTEFVGKLLGLVVMSIPEAEDEAVQFLQSMVRPVGLIEGRTLNKQDKERNEELWAAVEKELVNPELEDTLDLIERIIQREAEDIQSLGKRLQGMFKLAQRTGQLTPDSPLQPDQSPSRIPSSEPSTPADSSAASPEPSISSAPSTDGTTTPSSSSPSAD